MRSFGTEIDPNRLINHELSESARAAIIYAVNCRISKAKIARDFNVHRSTIYKTLKRFESTQNLTSLPRKGRPKKLPEITIRYIYRLVRKFPTISWKDLLTEIPPEIHQGVSKRTIQRILDSKGIRKWASKKRCWLKPYDAKRRRAWAEQWRHFDD